MILLMRGTRTAVRPPIWLARARVAKKVIQSPQEEEALAHQSLENGPLRKSSIYNPRPVSREATRQPYRTPQPPRADSTGAREPCPS